jgi:hypothetical protein
VAAEFWGQWRELMLCLRASTYISMGLRGTGVLQGSSAIPTASQELEFTDMALIIVLAHSPNQK